MGKQVKECGSPVSETELKGRTSSEAYHFAFMLC